MCEKNKNIKSLTANCFAPDLFKKKAFVHMKLLNENVLIHNSRQDGFILMQGPVRCRRNRIIAHPRPRADRELDKHSFSRADGEGGKVRLSLWNHPGDNIYGMFARSRNAWWTGPKNSLGMKSITTTRR
jgi:hypothetical protein